MNRPTMEDVAERAGVSRALVSLVMNDSPKVSDEKRLAVLRAARDLGYRPNLMARNLAQQRTRTLGVLVNDLHNPFFAEVIDGIETTAEERDYRVLVLNGRRNPERELTAIETLLQFQVEALILVGPNCDDDELEAISVTVPTVVVASHRYFPGVDAVVTDERRGGELAVEHLAGLGHRRIVHIDGNRNHSAAARRKGYESAMRSAGLAERIDVRVGGDDETDAFRAVEEILSERPRPTAVFAFNDLLAAGVLDRLDDAGLAPPDDISLVGYDNTFIAGLHHLSLTTVNQPRLAMGRLAVETILERIEDGREETVRHTLEPELVVRGTTGPPPRP
jgi:DNA-binding LacI/PurR family transcriptional regulator